MTTAVDIYVGDRQFRDQVQTRLSEPVKLPETTVADLTTDYPAADWLACLIYVSDGTGNKRLGVSDGTNWRFPDGNVVS